MSLRTVLDVASTLPEAFKLAIGRIKEIEASTLPKETPHTLQVWYEGGLLALASLYRTEQGDSPSLYVHWMREPTRATVVAWEVSMDMSMSFAGSFEIVWPTEDPSKNTHISLIADLLLTAEYAAPTKETFKVLYQVEREMGRVQAIATHLENDLGI